MLRSVRSNTTSQRRIWHVWRRSSSNQPVFFTTTLRNLPPRGPDSNAMLPLFSRCKRRGDMCRCVRVCLCLSVSVCFVCVCLCVPLFVCGTGELEIAKSTTCHRCYAALLVLTGLSHCSADNWAWHDHHFARPQAHIFLGCSLLCCCLGCVRVH